MEHIYVNIIIAVVTACFSVVGFAIKRIVSKVDKLEKESVSKNEVRVLIADKVDPLKERMERIEVKLDEIINILMRNK